MKKIKYIILGAGPAGLAFANRLFDLGETSFIILEKEPEAGGLCRSVFVDGSPLDFGGGHFLDTKNKKSLNFLFKFLPKNEWNKFNRISTIKLTNSEINYPFESNIWQFSIEKQINYLLSIFNTGSEFRKNEPKKFSDWITWKLGSQIAKDYMIPYNEKIWSINLNKLGTYWLHKLPDVSLKEILLSCLEKKPNGSIPAHSSFFYPKKFGYGEVWKRMANKLDDKIKYYTEISSIDVKNRIINEKYIGNKIVTTIPWTVLKFQNKIPKSIIKEIKSLEYASIRTTYITKTINTKAHWTYIPDKNIPEHRHLYRFNFINGAKGYWTETNEKRAGMIKEKNKLFWSNKFAYPLNTLNKPMAIKKILKYFSKNSIFGLGRWGEWEHMNSDVAVVKGIDLADKLFIKK